MKDRIAATAHAGIAFTGLILACCVAVFAFTADAHANKREDAELRAALDTLPCPNPKPRVAIYGFYATGKMGSYEGYNIGDGLAAQLATELTRTECFIVLDRTGLSNVLREQELALAGVVKANTGPRPGGLLGAEIVIKGTVTEFEANKRGRGLNLGVALPGIPMGMRLGRNGAMAHVGLDLAVVDASSGQVLHAHRVQADSASGGWTVGLDHRRGSLGGDSFKKSPLGIASRNALGKAIVAIAGDLSGIPWRSQVVDAVGGEVFLNAGSATGIEVGKVYRVSKIVRTLVDPATGLVLDTLEQQVGEVRITSVHEKYSIAQAIGEFPVERGAYVHE